MRKLSIISCVMWMIFIFYNSSKTGIESNNISFNIVNKITNGKIINENEEANKMDKGISKKINLFIRKSAHGIEFLILAILVVLVIKSFDIADREVIITTLFMVLLYAVTDEFHQLYVQGRNARVEDIVIDFIGGIIGVVIYYLVLNINKIIKGGGKNGEFI